MQDVDTYIELGKHWRDSLILLSQHRLPPELVNPSFLTGAFKELQETVKRVYPDHRVQYIDKELTYYYSHALATAVLHKDIFFMHIRVPVVNKDNILTVQHMLSFPLPMHPRVGQSNETNLGFVKLETDSPYLLVSSGGRYYREMNVATLHYCTETTMGVCSSLMVLDDAEVQLSCLMALFLGHYEAAMQLCDYKFFPADQAPFIFHVADSQFVVHSRGENASMVCMDRGNGTEVFNFSVDTLLTVTLPCQCSLSVSGRFVPALLSSCKPTLELIVFYPINFVQLLAFRLEHYLIAAPKQYVFNTTLVLDVLEPITPLDFTNFTAEDERLGVSLHSIVDTYLKGTISLASSPLGVLSDLPIEYVLIWCIDLCWHAILTAVAAVLIHNLQKLTTLVAVLMCQVQSLLTKCKADAQVVLTDGMDKDLITTFAPLAIIQTIYEDHASHFYQFLQFVALIVIVWTLVYVARQLHTLAVAFQPAHTQCECTAYLVMVNKRRSLTIPIKTFPFNVYAMTPTSIPLVTSLKLHITTFFQKHLVLKWDSKLHVSYLGVDFRFKLPSEIACPISLSRSLSTMEKERYSLALFAYAVILPTCACANVCSTFQDPVYKPTTAPDVNLLNLSYNKVPAEVTGHLQPGETSSHSDHTAEV
jgi:hypothetical protein